MSLSAAEIVATIRKERDLSMSSLAGLAGVPTSTVSRIEAGRSRPSLDTLVRVVDGAGFRLRLSLVDTLDAGDAFRRGRDEQVAREVPGRSG